MTNARGKWRILIIDDHPIVRQGLALLINHERDMEVCGEGDNPSEALKTIARLKPDLAIVDLSLQGASGLDLIKTVAERFPAVAVLVLSMHDESLYGERSLRAGARGYIMKEEASSNLLKAVRQVLTGALYASESLKLKMLEKLSGVSGPSPVSLIETLSDRELEVFEMIGDGWGTRQIAEKICVSVKTVESYRAHIKEKLKVESAAQLVQQAVQHRQLESPSGRNPPPSRLSSR